MLKADDMMPVRPDTSEADAEHDVLARRLVIESTTTIHLMNPESFQDIYRTVATIGSLFGLTTGRTMLTLSGGWLTSPRYRPINADEGPPIYVYEKRFQHIMIKTEYGIEKLLLMNTMPRGIRITMLAEIDKERSTWR